MFSYPVLIIRMNRVGRSPLLKAKATILERRSVSIETVITGPEYHNKLRHEVQQLQKLTFLLAEGLFCTFAFLNIDEKAVPLLRLSVAGVPQLTGHMKPPVHAVGATQPVLVLQRRARCDAAHPCVERYRPIVRMDGVEPGGVR